MSDVSTIVDTTFVKRTLTQTFLALLLKNNNGCNKRRQKVFLGEFICVMVCIIVYHAYHLYAFVFRVLAVFVRYIFFREISLYLTAINLLQLYNFVLIIRNKFTFLNRSLRKRIDALENNFNVDVYLTKYVEYCELVHVFNKLFGSRIFWVIGFVVIATVEGFQIGLNCFAHVRLHRLGDDSCEFVGAASFTELTIYSVRARTICITLYCLLFLQMLSLMFIAVCHQSCRQAEITKDLCYKLLVASRSFSGGGRDVERKLCILMEQFESHKPVFTASGFFNINYSLITAVWTYMVSNLIISLTFKGE